MLSFCLSSSLSSLLLLLFFLPLPSNINLTPSTQHKRTRHILRVDNSVHSIQHWNPSFKSFKSPSVDHLTIDRYRFFIVFYLFFSFCLLLSCPLSYSSLLFLTFPFLILILVPDSSESRNQTNLCIENETQIPKYPSSFSLVYPKFL